ncbi:YHS domain-containing (seleno)protein [Pseudoruegeria sp. SHC-113]|uniref:YHS domain-containing (seleno)protein n=1 Tax=Pseudoruegeria sp. SHC-113 TaxID=2855439 RepID=UPI0021BB68D6|nr:YHS domain-containing (seleno)protein [Pseudoruegeria sp. SHC-113]MCT8159858.1 YHS domain-containing protein [Pseudoruegeria sp. SHC-113]
MITRRTALGFLVAVPVAGTLARPALAAKPEIYAEGGVAINGYDPVAYFNESQPVKGAAAHAVSYKGATWHFASDRNKAAFEADPEAFAPKYGGYCAYAVSKGGTATTSPDAWTIHEGRLYLNYNTTVRGIWSEDIPGNVAKADANWPKVLEA